jgi:hypothetical protein
MASLSRIPDYSINTLHLLPQISGWRLSLVLLLTFLGTTLLIGTAYNLIVYSYDPHGPKKGMRWWVRATVLLVSTILGVVIFGGLSMALVYLLDRMFGTGPYAAGEYRFTFDHNQKFDLKKACVVSEERIQAERLV